MLACCRERPVAPPPPIPAAIEPEERFETSVDAYRPKAAPLTVIAIIVSGVAICSYYFFLFRYSYNFPYFDDFEVIVDFLNRFLTTGDFSEKLRLLFEQHNEHRPVFDRMVALMEYYSFGAIEFRSIVFIGNAALVVMLVWFLKTARQNAKLNGLHLASVPLLLFNFRYFQASFWPMAALQNLWVLAFALLAFYFLFQSSSVNAYAAAAFGSMAIFTSGNGTAIFVAGAVVLALNRQLFSKKSLIWTAGGLIAIAIFMNGYAKPSDHPGLIRPVLDNPIEFGAFVLAFFGNMFTESVPVAVAIGGALVMFVGYLGWKRYFAQDPICFALMLFVVLTGALAASSRSRFGAEAALVSRYGAVSTLLIVSCYIALMSLVPSRRRTVCGVAVLIASLGFHYNTYAKYLPAKKAEKADFERSQVPISQGRLSRFGFGWPPLDPRREFPKQALRTADSLGYFSFKFRDAAEIIESLPSRPERESVHHFDRFELKDSIVVMLDGWALIKGIDSRDVIPVICFKDEKHHPVKYIVLQAVPRDDLARQYGADYLMSGFRTIFNAREIKRGQYTLSLFLVAPDFKIEIDAGPTRLGQ